MRRFSWLVVVAVLAACNVKSGFSGGSTTPSGGTSTTSTASSGTAGQDASAPSGASPAPSGSPNDRMPMINLMGKTPEEAIAALRAAGFGGELEINRTALECVDAEQKPGYINCQSPDVGKMAYRNMHVNVTVYQTPTHHGRITTAQLDKMKGMTVDEAKRYLKSIGHTGQVKVKEDQVHFHSGCAKDRVCEYGPAGVQTGDDVTLVLNKKSVDITLPD